MDKKLNNFMKYILSIFVFLLLINCNSYKNSLVGTWQLTRIYDGDDAYLTSSEHKFKDVKSDKTITLKKDGTFLSNENLCRDGSDLKRISSGKYSMKKYNRIEHVFTLESDQCPGIGSNLRIKIKNGKLELDYPSIGYYYESYERIK
jgi:hypothetical protein